MIGLLVLFGGSLLTGVALGLAWAGFRLAAGW